MIIALESVPVAPPDLANEDAEKLIEWLRRCARGFANKAKAPLETL